MQDSYPLEEELAVSDNFLGGIVYHRALMSNIHSSWKHTSPDTNFDDLIKSIYGDVEQLEKYEQETITKLNKQKNMNNAYTKSRMMGLQKQRVCFMLYNVE